MTTDIDALAQEIRRIDGAHSLGAGALAEALWPYVAALQADTREWARGGQLPPLGVDVIGVWSSRDEFPPEVELCGVPQAGNPERQWFNAYGPCAAPDRWMHVPSGTWERAAPRAEEN